MSYFNNEIESVFSKIEQADNIVIFGHKNPDGDCVGSVMGLREALRTLFPNKTIYGVGTHPSYIAPCVVDSDVVSDEFIKSALAVMVDLSDLDRVEDQRILTAKEIVCIDHHVKQVDVNFPIIRDELAPSATFIITKCLLERYHKIPSQLAAKYLYMGLVTDTGRFQFDSEPETLEVAKSLIEHGFDYKEIYSILYRQSSSDLKFRAVVYSNFKFDGLVSYVCISKKMYEEIGLTQNEAGGKVNLLSLLDNHPMWAAFTEQDDGTIRVELRSNGHYNVQKVAIIFGGGGHIPASGCKLTTFDDVPKVLEALNKAEQL